VKVITSDWLGIQIAVFPTYESYEKVAKKKGFPPYDPPPGTMAFYKYCVAEDGETFFGMCFMGRTPSYNTIVHETSHITDCIFGHIGAEVDTETEAYFHSWLFSEVLEIVTS